MIPIRWFDHYAAADQNITGDSEQSPSRKIREIFRAMELERAYSKDKILETYMNYIGFGGTSNGIEHAAQIFRKSAKDLDVAEAACLAAIRKVRKH
ncbi:MAG: transglycosylase domain-containing protein [Ruminococcus callidus]